MPITYILRWLEEIKKTRGFWLCFLWFWSMVFWDCKYISALGHYLLMISIEEDISGIFNYYYFHHHNYVDGVGKKRAHRICSFLFDIAARLETRRVTCADVSNANNNNNMQMKIGIWFGLD